jgi:arsenite methyltransferase
VLSHLTLVRDRVLDEAGSVDGECLLDVGCGEGLIGFLALERGARTVTFSDISNDLLEFCREAAAAFGYSTRVRFVAAPADALQGVADSSQDVVTTRSVLIYVQRKDRAFHEFARVLRPGGRISLFEPINRFALDGSQDGFFGYPLRGLEDVTAKLRAVFQSLQPPDSDPMLDFDERDLIRWAEGAGFFPVKLTLEALVEPTPPREWHGFLTSAGNPNIPTVGEAMHQALTDAECEQLEAHLRPLVENGLGVWRMATAYLVATKRA